MHIHILGICGTFMGGLALIARELGYKVTGSDANVYPPMSTQLAQQGITLNSGYSAENLNPQPDQVIIGNALSRGNPEVEAVLNQALNYTSGAQWLAEHVLHKRWVLAVAGTHGKTTTTSMLAWILEDLGYEAGFLIGGIPLNFGISARLGSSDFFVIEADEYDSAFFDKRSKFVHYRPRTLILNNLEYDHADIFPDLAAIQRQFQHLIRTVPSEGLIIQPEAETNLEPVINAGCWSAITNTGINSNADWQANLLQADGSIFEISFQGQLQARLNWNLTGEHNVYNALAAIAAARHVGVLPKDAAQALSKFKNVKRRMEIIARIRELIIYDDFAHHPTAIATTLDGLRKQVGSAKIIAVVELRSNTMQMGVHQDTLAPALQLADVAMVYQTSSLSLSLAADNLTCYTDLDILIAEIVQQAVANTHIVLMSNGSFGNIYQKLPLALT